MNTHSLALFISVFLACAVEMVEAVTIVLAAGTARHWKSALQGVISALIILSFAVAIFGPAITALPIGILRTLVGALLLTFGMQWLRKAIMRGAGHKSLHDEAGIFAHEVLLAQRAERKSALFVDDWYAFTLSFKGVLLEGLEVVFLVLTFGAIQGEIRLASVSALSALAVVVVAALVIHKPLSQVPENQLKFIVGIMCVTFGIFWGVEGSGAHWPMGNVELLILLPTITFISLLLTKYLSSHERVSDRKPISLPTNNAIQKFIAFWFDFIIGDDWRVAAVVAASFTITHFYRVWMIIPIAMIVALFATVKEGSSKKVLEKY